VGQREREPFIFQTLLHEQGISQAVVNPRRVRDFAKGIGRDAKTDPIDSGGLLSMVASSSQPRSGHCSPCVSTRFQAPRNKKNERLTNK
jgi:hypothetical protein